MKKKILVLILSTAVLATVFFADYQYSHRDSSINKKAQLKQANNRNIAKARKAKNVAAGDKSGTDSTINESLLVDFAVLYTNVSDLVKAADVIIEGKVIGVSYFDYNTITYTKARVKVIKSYRANVKPGEVLTFVEEGGITTKANLIRYSGNKLNQPITEADEKTKVKVGGLNGAPVTKLGERAIYFAVKSGNFFLRGRDGSFEPTASPNQIPVIFYVTIGAYQGKFMLNSDGTVQRYIPRGDEGPKYTSLKMTRAEFDRRITAAIKN